MITLEQPDRRHENPLPAPRSRRTIRLRRTPLRSDVIVVAVRWYLRSGLSYRDVEGLLSSAASRSTTSPIYRWVVCFTPRRARLRPPGRQGGQPVLRAGLDTAKVTPSEVTTDQAAVYPAVLEALLPAARHRTDQYASNAVACDHGRLKRGYDRCEARAGPSRP